MSERADEERSERGARPQRIAGKYVVHRTIASGGMGTVYEVEHAGTGERLALKVLKGAFDSLDPTELERFRREARVHASLKNEHVVRVIDADVAPELGGAPYLVMDLLEGQTLADSAGDQPQPPTRVVELLGQLAGAMDQAHRAGIVHRDLKPENLFLCRRADGSELLKILDFGVAKFRGTDDRARTVTGALVGTPLYMAREQAAGEHDQVGPGTDIWSIAMIAFRLLSGREYWTSGNVSLLLADIVSKPVQPPSRRGLRLGDRFDAWFLRSCAPVPGDRFTGVSDQIAALARALELPEPIPSSGPAVDRTLPATGISSPAVSAAPVAQSLSGSVASAQRSEGRPALPAVAVVLGALALVGVGLFAVSRSRGVPPATPAAESSSSRPAPPSVAASHAPEVQEPAPPLAAAAPSAHPATSANAAAGGRDAGALPREAKRVQSQPPPRDPLADPK